MNDTKKIFFHNILLKSIIDLSTQFQIIEG